MRYPSAKSLWFSILIWGVVCILAASFVYFLWQSNWMVCLLTAAGIFFLLWIWFGTFYEFKDTYLLARLGPFFERIPYSRITAARKFKSMASSMALSSQMIEIRHGKNYITGTTYISPLDRDGFLENLRIRCPAVDKIPGGSTV